MEIKVTCEQTPNPQSLKFVLNTQIASEILEITDRNQASRSPLAAKILGFPWAKSVFIGENFITITKEDWLEWDMLSDPIADMIQGHIEKGEKVILQPPTSTEKSTNSDGKTDAQDCPTTQKIKSIITKEIQPAVAMDGGYIEFVSYKENIVYLSLQGACSGCPSASYTLKEGIQTRLQQDIPEIKEVVSV